MNLYIKHIYIFLQEKSSCIGILVFVSFYLTLDIFNDLIVNYVYKRLKIIEFSRQRDEKLILEFFLIYIYFFLFTQSKTFSDI